MTKNFKIIFLVLRKKKLIEQNISHPCTEAQPFRHRETDSAAEKQRVEMRLGYFSVILAVTWHEKVVMKSINDALKGVTQRCDRGAKYGVQIGVVWMYFLYFP